VIQLTPAQAGVFHFWRRSGLKTAFQVTSKKIFFAALI